METPISTTLASAPPRLATSASERRSVRRVVGGIISALPVLFLVFDASIKFANIAPVTESFIQLGYSADIAPLIATIELLCLAIYIVPRTSILGAVLLTGYLGGAVATHVRVESPLFSHVLFPIYVAALLWTGLYLRDSRVSALLRSKTDKE